MKSLYENITEYTQELYNEYLKFYRKKFAIKDLIIYFCGIFVLVIVSWRGIKRFKWLVLVFWIVIYLAVYLIKLIRYKLQKIITKEECNSIKTKQDKSVKYFFYNSYFETEYQGKKDKISYLKLKNVYEFEDRYYFIINKECAFIVLKEGFKDNKQEEFEEFFKVKGNFKFRKYKINKSKRVSK